MRAWYHSLHPALYEASSAAADEAFSAAADEASSAAAVCRSSGRQQLANDHTMTPNYRTVQQSNYSMHCVQLHVKHCVQHFVCIHMQTSCDAHAMFRRNGIDCKGREDRFSCREVLSRGPNRLSYLVHESNSVGDHLLMTGFTGSIAGTNRPVNLMTAHLMTKAFFLTLSMERMFTPAARDDNGINMLHLQPLYNHTTSESKAYVPL